MLIRAVDRGKDRASPGDADVVKAIIMAKLPHIVSKGGAVAETLESGIVELRFATGEIFHLGEKTVTRIA